MLIIGAGPAGLFAAIELAKNKKKVAIIEKNEQAGRKLLLSGLGQCNLTQGGDMLDYANHYGDNYKYIKNALDFFGNMDTIDFFEKRGLKMETLDNGKVFPLSRSAQDLLDVLLKECIGYGVTIRYNQAVTRVRLLENGFDIKTDRESFEAEHLIVATGGKSYPKTGSSGDGYVLGAQLGHKIIDPAPALTSIEIEAYPFEDLAGISLVNVLLEIWRDGKKLREDRGDILFTHKGLSGPLILNNSRWMRRGDGIRLNFVEKKNEKEFDKELQEQIDASGKLMIKTLLRKEEFPKRLIESLLKHTNISEETKCSQIDKSTRKLLSKSFTGLSLTIASMGGYHMAMVTSGGISMKEVNPTTMESRLRKRLYFIGEVLDIDGDTGGYNIQAAFSTAMLCAKAIGGQEKNNDNKQG